MRGAVPALLVLLATAHPAQAKDQRSELMAAGERWNALYAAGDWDSLRAFYTEDAWRMSNRSPAEKGVEAIIANLRSFRDRGASVSFRHEPEDVRVDGRIATVISRYRMTAESPGSKGPQEIHPVVEEAFLLGGTLTGPQGTMHPGAYFWRPPGISHGPFGARWGAVSLIRFVGGHHVNVWTDSDAPFDFKVPYQPVLPQELAHLSELPWQPAPSY